MENILWFGGIYMALKENLKENLTLGLSKIVKTVGEGAATVAKKSGEIVEISKLNLNISTEKNNIEKLYMEIGEAVFEKYKNGAAVDLDLEKACREIEEANDNIRAIKEKIEEIKNSKENEENEEDDEDDENACGCVDDTELVESELMEDEVVVNCEANPCNFREMNEEDDIIK